MKNLRVFSCALGVISLFLPWYTEPYLGSKLQFTLIEIFNLESGNYFKLPIFKINIFAAGNVGTVTLLFFGVGCAVTYFYNEWGSLLMAVGVGYYSYHYIFSAFQYGIQSALLNVIYNKLLSNLGLSLAIFSMIIGIISLLLNQRIFKNKGYFTKISQKIALNLILILNEDIRPAL